MTPRRTEVFAAIGMTLAVVVLTTQALANLPSVSTPQPHVATVSPMHALSGTVTATQPLSLDYGMLFTIQSLPPALTETIDAATYSTTEIIDAQHTTKVPLEPLAPAIEDAWCITVYPEVTITLYVQGYVAPKDAIWVKAGDYVPGVQHTGRINRFIALERRERWELYHPEVYRWSSLGCS